MRQPTVSLIESGNPAARIDSVLALLAALDLEFQVAPRSRRSSSDLDDLLS
jgi:HTH-type transcriptional regulator/antitoxin HipB